MNIERLLRNSLFDKKDILNISFFLLNFKNIEEVYFSTSKEENESLTIYSDNTCYVFIKLKSNLRFILFSLKDGIHTDYHIGETGIKKYLSHFKIKDEVSGQSIKRKTFQTIYEEDSLSIHVIYPEKQIRIKSMIICIENFLINNDSNSRVVERNINYFEININNSNKKRANFKILDNYFDKKIKRVESNEAAEIFKQYINYKNIYDAPYTEEIIEEYRMFSSIYKIISI